MDADAESGDGDAERPAVAACGSRPGRTVFVEDGNCDGWLASDLTVEPTR
jgi:hypothetical protein